MLLLLYNEFVMFYLEPDVGGVFAFVLVRTGFDGGRAQLGFAHHQPHSAEQPHARVHRRVLSALRVYTVADMCVVLNVSRGRRLVGKSTTIEAKYLLNATL